MAPVYTCFRQLHPPTSVELAVWGSVTGPGKRDLLIARRALLEIYSVPTAAEGGDDDNPVLELVGGYPLTANILHIGVVKLGADSADVIVLALDAAKLTVVAYDAGLSQLVTLSIHNLEAGAIGPGSGVLDEGYDLLGAQMHVPPTLTAVDAAGRCCAMLVAGRHLIILPMLRHLPSDIFISKEGRDHITGSLDSSSSATEAAAGGTAAPSSSRSAGGAAAAAQGDAPSAGSQWTEGVGAARSSWGRWVAQKPFSVDLEDAGVLGSLKHLAFLHGFNEPALALLHEPKLTWGGRLAHARHTCRLTLLSLNLQQGRAPPIWRVTGLPSDSHTVAAPPLPQGGALVISVNGVVRVCEGEAVSALGVNGFATVTVGGKGGVDCALLKNEGDYGWASVAGAGREQEVFDLADEASPVELDAAVCTFLAPDCALLALREGSLALLRLHPADSSMTLRTVGACPPAACLCATSYTTSLTESDAPQPVGESPKQAEEAETGLVFLGSHLGDSLLVGYSAVRGTAAVDASEWLSLMRVAVKQEEQEQGEGGWGDWKSDSPPEGEIRGDASGDSTAAVAVAAAVAAAADVSDAMDEGSDSGDMNGHADDECTIDLTRDEEAELLYGPNWRVTNQFNGHTTVKTEPDDTAAATAAPTVAGIDTSDTTAGAAAADVDADTACTTAADTTTAEAGTTAGADDREAMDVVNDAAAAVITADATAADATAATETAAAATGEADAADADTDVADSTKTVESLSVKFRVLDSLPGLGPITTIQVNSVAVGPPPISALPAPPPAPPGAAASNGRSTVKTEPDATTTTAATTTTPTAAVHAAISSDKVPPAPPCANALVCSTGYEKGGGIALVWPGLRTDTVAQFPFPQASAVWTLSSSSTTAASSGDGDKDMDDSSKSDAAVSMLVSGGSWTRLLKGDSSAVIEVEESTDDNPFVSEARTLAAAPLLYGYTAQVHEQGIRVVGATGEPAQDVMAHEPAEAGGAGVDEGVQLKQAAVAGGYVLLVLADGALKLLAQEPEEEGCDLVYSEPPAHLSVPGAVDTASLFCTAQELFTHLQPPTAPYPPAYTAALARGEAAAHEDGYTSETEEWAHLYGTAAGNGSSSSSSSSSDGHSSDSGNSSGAEAPVSAGTGGAAAMDVDGPLAQPLGQPLGSSTAAVQSDAHTRFTPAAAAWTRAEHCTVTYCVLCRSGGTLEVYRLQRAADVSADASADASGDVVWSLVFAAAGASGAPSTLWDDAATAAATSSTAAVAGGRSGSGAGDQHSAEAEAHSMDVVDTADGYGSAHGLQQPLDGPLDAGGASPGTKKSKKRKSKTGGDSSSSTADSAAAAAAAVAYDTVADVLLQPVGAVKAPAALQRLALVLRLSSGDLLVYEARFGAAAATVACFIKLAHDFIARPMTATTPSTATSSDDSAVSGGRTLTPFTDVSGYRGVAFFGTNCRAGVVLAERGAICVLPLGQHRRAGVSSLACIPPNPLVPSGGLIELTADPIPQLRVLSGAPMSGQLITPGCAGGSTGGGQGHFAVQKLTAGVTVRRMVRLRAAPTSSRRKPGVLAQLLATPAYAATVSYKVDVHTEPPEEKETATATDTTDDAATTAAVAEAEDEVDNSHVNYKNFAAPDAAYGGAPPLLVDRFELRVLIVSAANTSTVSTNSSVSSSSGGGIEVVQTIALQRDEHALCLEMVTLGPDNDRKPFVICGTGFVGSQGEDSPAKGRLLLYELDYSHVEVAQTEPEAEVAGGLQQRHRHLPKLRLAQEKIMSGPIGAAAQLCNTVVTSAGASVTLYEWDPRTTQLKPVGIYEASQYVVTMSVARNYLLLGDAVNSVQFMCWRDEDRSLNMVSKDYEPAEIYATVFLIDQPALGMVICDSSGNIKIMRYGPQALASRGGHKLLCDADFYLGCPAASLAPVRLRNNKLNAPRFGAAVGGTDGSVSLLAPVDERVYRRLYALQGVLCNALEHGAAANPRGARLYRSSMPAAAAVDGTRMKGVLDGALLWRFVALPVAQQAELTRAIGTTVDTVLSNMLEIDLQASML